MDRAGCNYNRDTTGWNQERLKELRKQAGVSAKDVADSIGIPHESYRIYEAGRGTPNIQVAIKIAKFFGVSIAELVDEESIGFDGNYAKALEEKRERKVSREIRSTLKAIERNGEGPIAPYPFNLIYGVVGYPRFGIVVDPDDAEVLMELTENIPDWETRDRIRRYFTLDEMNYEFTEKQEEGLAKVLSSLKPRERKVLELRFKEGMTLEEVGKIFGVSRERVRQIEAVALRTLRHPSNSRLIIYGEREKNI